MGFDLSEVSVDASLHKAPSGGDGTGKSPVDRGKSGWKWSLLCDRAGIPISWAADDWDRYKRRYRSEGGNSGRLLQVRHTAELDAALDAVEETTAFKAQADALATQFEAFLRDPWK